MEFALLKKLLMLPVWFVAIVLTLAVVWYLGQAISYMILTPVGVLTYVNLGINIPTDMYEVPDGQKIFGWVISFAIFVSALWTYIWERVRRGIV